MSESIKDKIIIFGAVLLAAILIFNGIYFGPKAANKIKTLYKSTQYVSVDDNISGIVLYDKDNNETELGEGYKFIVYMSSSCSTCISHIPTLRKVNEIFCKDENLKLVIVWEDEFPGNGILEEYGLSDCSYLANGFYMAKRYNTVFLADEDNNIIFRDETGYEGIIDKLIELEVPDMNELTLNSNAYIIKTIVKHYGSKANLIYFSMPGCPDCAEADPIVYDSEVADKFNITRIEISRGADTYDIKDEYSIFKKIYLIDWYPSFLIIKNDGTWDIIRRIEIDDMKEEILKNQ